MIRSARRLATLVALLLAAAVAAPGPAPAAAEDWPARPVRLIVPFGPGSTPDLIARVVAEALQQRFGQPFLVENKAGAGGNLGTDAVAKAEPDGYTFGVSIAGPLAINPLLLPKMPYDPGRDFAFVTTLATQPCALAVNNALGVSTVAELIEKLRRDPGKYNYASIGNGSLSHLAMEAIAMASGTTIVHIAYASSPQAATAIIRGDVQMGCLPAIAATSQAEAGNLKVIAVSTPQRSALIPGVPTLKEAGIDVEADAWNGLIAPAGTPPAILARIGDAVRELLSAPAVRDRLATQVMEPIPSTPEAFRARVEAEIARWKPVIAAAGIKAN
ncbi:MAG: tripartite tricarboxylate transporter substrate binding protein [Rhodoplanes sp.]|uniref:Bug family tripartite tricarboxylate transporter substrate binding protein n=1 Tax=Rhodoplanes sp. TaxID=1968906 RepID=UPI0018344512|nr:tripartite tricarboxylate transporter substrate binding protein [Rhodoplanes sp.]NVO16545.1 tripartite tricarboxylate transporter substrate binding protein [Rhodoplanes sp.]